MLKLLFLSVILLSALNISATAIAIAPAAGGNAMTVTYIAPSAGEALRVRFGVAGAANLKTGEATVGICCTAGNACFGAAFYCAKAECTSGADLTNAVYAGTFTPAAAPASAKWGLSALTQVAGAKGSVNAGTGTNFSTRYSFTAATIAASNIPQLNAATANLICHTTFNKAGATLFTADIPLPGTAPVYAERTAVTFFVAAGDVSPEEVVPVATPAATPAAKASGAFTQLLSLGALSALVAFFTIV